MSVIESKKFAGNINGFCFISISYVPPSVIQWTGVLRRFANINLKVIRECGNECGNKLVAETRDSPETRDGNRNGEEKNR